FESIFDPNDWGAISTKVYSPPILESKSGQNNPQKRRTQVLVQLLKALVVHWVQLSVVGPSWW
ncbi:MAG: hypothetical protein KGZ39_05155, partial [Simkania sp.]|nr:hypothetical protein [Simkania sp.]